MPRLRQHLLVLALAVGPACVAAPLPDDPGLDRPVTMEADAPVPAVLAELSKAAGVRLAAGDHMDDLQASLCVRNVPLRRALSALIADLGLECQKAGDGYCLSSPTIEPAPTDNRRLIQALLAACPAQVRPPLGRRPPDDTYVPPPMDQVYALLTRQQRDTIEEGGEVPFAQLPSQARRLLQQYRQDATRRELWRTLSPRWAVPVDQLALQILEPGQNVAWSVRVRREPAGATAANAPPDPPELAWDSAQVPIPYQPVVASTGAARTPLGQAAVAVAREAGANMVACGLWQPSAGRPFGETAEARLTSLLPETMQTCRWRQEDGLLRLGWPVVRFFSRVLARPAPDIAPSPAVGRARRSLQTLLPADYRPLVAMGATRRGQAIRLPWVRLWRSFTDQQRRPGQPIQVAQLSPEQQAWLQAGLQSQMVAAFLAAIDDGLGSRLEEASASLDFPVDPRCALGFPRELHVREGEVDLLSGRLESQPPILRLLLSRDPALRKEADLRTEEEPVGHVTERLSELLAAPVIAQEPPGDVKLTADLKGRPMRMLMHWVERRTGLQWRKRESVYVLSPPVSVTEVMKDVTQAIALLGEGPRAEQRPERLQEVARSVSAEDREALAQGPVPLAQLSAGLQDAILRVLAGSVRGSTDNLGQDWRLLNGLGDARARLREDSQYRMVIVEVPGVGSREWGVGRRPGTYTHSRSQPKR